MNDRDNNFRADGRDARRRCAKALHLPTKRAWRRRSRHDADAAADTLPAAARDPAAARPDRRRPGVATAAPTLADVAALSAQSDYARFVAEGVAPEVKNAALKKLFTDPHFNVMDGLDTYIDDYGKPDPLPAGMLRKMAQSQLLGLFDDEDRARRPRPRRRGARPRHAVRVDCRQRSSAVAPGLRRRAAELPVIR